MDPVLQLRCTKCHNEQFAGAFQLIRYKTKADRTPEARSANLDAVLSLIDMENPAKSELLLVHPSGSRDGGECAADLPGSNNPEYQILAAWVNRLKTTLLPPPERGGSGPVWGGGLCWRRTVRGRSESTDAVAADPDSVSGCPRSSPGGFDPSVSVGMAPCLHAGAA